MANEKMYPNYLMHYRTKGSKNGISTTKGYTAIGQKAKGRWVNGRYVYDTPKSYSGNSETNYSGRVSKPPVPDYDNLLGRSYPATETGKRQSWQQIGNNYRAADEAVQRAATGQSRAVDISGNGRPQREEATNRYIAAVNEKNKYSQSHYNAVSQAAAERKAREAALGRQKKQSQQNASKKNNWQQTANKTAGILGNMSREDRSLMKSREWVARDKNGKKQVNNGFNVNNKYGYSNYTKDDKGWHDVHMGEYNTTGVKGVKKQQDWNTSFERNHRSDIGNAIADAKEDAKKAFKEAKADAKQTYVNLKSKLKSKFKKKKSLKDLFK